MRWPRQDPVWTPPFVGADRRRAPRYYVQLPVELPHGTGTTVDVSEDGVRFESTHRFADGESLTLRLVFRHFAGDTTHIDVTGEVVRVEERGELFLVAVQAAEIHLL